MNQQHRFLLLATLFAALLSAAPSSPKETGNSLSAEDKKLLDDLLKGTLFDPKGAERVRIKVTLYSVWGGKGEVHRAIFPPRNLMV